jgi:hypothetical protein
MAHTLSQMNPVHTATHYSSRYQIMNSNLLIQQNLRSSMDFIKPINQSTPHPLPLCLENRKNYTVSDHCGLNQDKDQWQVLVNMVMNIYVP